MSAFSYEIKDQIAFLKFDTPQEKINKIDMKIAKELEVLLEVLKKETTLQAVVLYSGKRGVFIAGADINLIKSIRTKEEGEKLSLDAQGLADYLEAYPLPITCAVNGACLGGGLEVALACDYRVVSDDGSTSLGLPEVKLGIIPGMGGCVRLPKLVGLQQSLNMILAGSTVNGYKALKIGLADELVPHELFLEKVCVFVRSCGLRKRKAQKSVGSLLLERNPLGRALLFKMAEKNVLSKTKGQYPAPLAALQVIKKSVSVSQKEALKFEAQKFGEMSVTPISKNLINIFFLNEEIKKDKGVARDIKPRDIKSIGVVGAGAMGGGIAQLAAYKDIHVRLKDINDGALNLGLNQARKIFNEALSKRKISQADFDQRWTLISPTLAYTGFKSLDVVIEAVVEDLNVKKKVFSQIEEVTSPESILASNTSSISIDEIGADLKHPERMIGMHFFNPVHQMPLVEVIPGSRTAEEAIVTIVALSKKLSKLPLVVKNRPGFLVNRVLMPYLNEAGFLAEEGASIELIDRVALQFGMPMGPFVLLDEVGIDIVAKAAKVVEKAFAPRAKLSPLIQGTYDLGRYGKKTKKGFYDYNAKMRRAGVSEQVLALVKSKKELSKEEIERRLFYPMVNEACLCLEEEIVKSPSYLDIGMIFGIGFAPFNGGVLKYADSEGLGKIADTLSKWHDVYGPRFQVSKLLQSMRGKKFYG